MDGKTHTISTGDLLLTIPGSSHYEEGTHSSSMEILFLIFNSTFSPSEYFGLEFPSSLILHTDNKSEINQILHNILVETMEYKNRYDIYLNAEIARLFVSIYRMLNNTSLEIPETNSLSALIDIRKSRIISEIKSYMEEHVNTNTNIGDIAANFYISPQHLVRLFREVTHQTPKEYLTILRINWAKDLLKNTDEKISSIAEKLGYTDIHYFYRAFKKETSMTPSQYRVSVFY